MHLFIMLSCCCVGSVPALQARSLREAPQLSAQLLAMSDASFVTACSEAVVSEACVLMSCVYAQDSQQARRPSLRTAAASLAASLKLPALQLGDTPTVQAAAGTPSLGNVLQQASHLRCSPSIFFVHLRCLEACSAVVRRAIASMCVRTCSRNIRCRHTAASSDASNAVLLLLCSGGYLCTSRCQVHHCQQMQSARVE